MQQRLHDAGSRRRFTCENKVRTGYFQNGSSEKHLHRLSGVWLICVQNCHVS